VRILKDKNDESKGAFWSENYDLHRIQINKGNFADMNNKEIGSNEDCKRVYGKFMLQFNLKKILANINKFASIKSKKERNKAIRSKSMASTSMKGVNYNPNGFLDGSSFFFPAEPAPVDPTLAPLPFQEDAHAALEFETQLNKFFDEITELTPYTVSGLSLSSQFSIAVRIEMMPIGIFGTTNFGGEEEIPIIIRSQKAGNHIHDLM
jgi:hypothetical protein